jgi:hypothetical protein
MINTLTKIVGTVVDLMDLNESDIDLMAGVWASQNDACTEEEIELAKDQLAKYQALNA